MERLRIFIADDHALVREGLRLLIESQPDMEVVGVAESGQEAVQKACQLRPDLIVMDISMPGLSGVKASEQLKEECPEVKILVLTAHEEIGYLNRLLHLGVSGYLLKRAAGEELIHAIRTAISGGVYLDPTLVSRVVEGYSGKQSLQGALKGGELSEREAEVLRLIAWGYSNKEVAARLNVSVKTVEAHKSNLMKKLDLGSRVDIVRYALQRGWLQDS